MTADEGTSQHKTDNVGQSSDATERRSVPRGLLVGLAVLLGTVAAGAVAWFTGLGGQPYGRLLVPAGVGLVAGLLALLQRGAFGERAVAVAVAALVGVLVGGGVATATPLAPAELERRVRALVGDGVTLESLTRSGAPACRPCAQVDAVLRTPAGTVDQPLVAVLTALKREGLATTLLDSSIRPDTSTASGESDEVSFALTAVPEYVEGKLTEVVALRVRAKG